MARSEEGVKMQQSNQGQDESEETLDLELEELEAKLRISLKMEKRELLRNQLRESQERIRYLKNLIDGPQLSKSDLCSLQDILTKYDEKLECFSKLEERARNDLQGNKDKQCQVSIISIASCALKIGQHLIAPRRELCAKAIGAAGHVGALYAGYRQHSAEQMLNEQVTELIQEANGYLDDCKELKRKFDEIVFGKDVNKEYLLMAQNAHEAALNPLLKTIISEDSIKAVVSATELVSAYSKKNADESEEKKCNPLKNGKKTKTEHEATSTCKKYWEELNYVGLFQDSREMMSAMARFCSLDSDTSLNFVCRQISYFLDTLKDERKSLQKKYESFKPQ